MPAGSAIIHPTVKPHLPSPPRDPVTPPAGAFFTRATFLALTQTLILILSLAPSSLCLAATAATTTELDFNRDIRPILSDHCFACHGPDEAKRKARLRLDSLASATATLRSGDRAVVPGDPQASALVARITTDDPHDLMPPPGDGKPLNPQQRDLLIRWIREGAHWQEHWAFVPPAPPSQPNPTIAPHSPSPNPIDAFIDQKRDAAGIAAAPKADPATLLRRVTLDLTGLPPTPEELDTFLADPSPKAYDTVVDRLLASPHYGERMAVPWLDLSRFADTSGYHFDGVRFMWLWRDWVIRAFNDNKPYDIFTVEQLAGDLLPQPTREQRLATGFVRNNMTNDEGGADPDEYLNKYVADRVNTLGNAWLGMTVACAECHDHKFDPIRTREYYQLYAFFHNVPEKGLDRIRTDNPPPRLPVPTEDQAFDFVEADFRLRDAEKTLQDRINELGETQEKWERETLSSPMPTPNSEGLLLHLPFDDTWDVISPHGTNIAATAPTSSLAGTIPSGPRLLRDDPPEFVAGRLGKALKLDGRTHLDLGPLVSFDRTNAFSFGTWVKIQGHGALLSRMDPAPSHRGFDLLVQDGRFVVHLIHHYPDNALKVLTRQKFEGPHWRHVLMTHDGSGKASGLRVYVDGQSRDLDVERDALSNSITSNQPLRIGSRAGDTRFTGTLDDLRIYDRTLSPAEAQTLALHGLWPVLSQSRGQRSAEDRADLHRFYKEQHAVDFLRAERALAEARTQKETLIAAIPTAMIMEEMQPPRDTHVLVRGDFRTRGERVLPGTPEFLPPLRATRFSNAQGRPSWEYLAQPPSNDWIPSRLDLAAWLVSPEHPLTARVTVNRFWALFFGAGLVNTPNDLGAQGEWPSHPALLDFLAIRFRDGDPAATPPVPPWDVKSLIRLIVTSHTYQQSAVVDPETLEKDPYNRLLARGPRLPLDAEFVRDHALAVSGLLNTQVGGPSVKPYQPPGLWDGTDSVFVQDHGIDLYRRGLYVFWRRSAHYPSFAAFDAPNREVCTVFRQRTQTPLQSLVLMNDPAFVEAARALAQRVMKESPPDAQQRLTRAFRLTLSRPPAPEEIDTLRRTYEQQLTTFQDNPHRAIEFLKVGESPVPDGLDRPQLAALTAVANVLLNLNETITR